jgi:hypothetical protein
MSMTSRQTTAAPPATIDRHERRSWNETRLFAKTSEFWAMLVGIAVIVVVYNAADDSSLDLWRACLLGTALAAAYIVSRGFAKAGTRAPESWDGHDGRASAYDR